MNEKTSFHHLSPNRFEHLTCSTDNLSKIKPYQNTQITINEDIVKLQKEKINTLKQTIKSYQRNSEIQNAKLSTQDTLIIELNSLNKNYSQLEDELNQYKSETFRLNEIIQNKNNIIAEFQRLIELSTTKFEIFEETNNALRLKIEECETKLQSLPNIVNDNKCLKGKQSSYETQLERLTNENCKLESAFKAKISNVEKSKNEVIRQNEEDMHELKITIERLKIENEKYKKMAQEANLTLVDKENAFKIKIEDKEREYDKLSKRLIKLQQELKDIELTYKDKMTLARESNEKIDKDIKALTSELRGRNDENRRLNNSIFDYTNTISGLEQELKARGNVINNLTDEKDMLIKQLNDKQIDFVDYQNSSQQEIDIFHRKTIIIDKERASLIKENEALKKELFNLKQLIASYETQSKSHMRECQDVDKKYNELVQTLELKDEEHESEYEQFSSLLSKNQNEVNVLKAKYEKKIQMLKITNEELETRVKNLINSLISLKDYAISIERNMNVSVNDNLNMSMTMNNSGFVNNNLNLSTVNYTSRSNKDCNNNSSKRVISALKEMIGKIDSKIISAQGNDNKNSMTYQFDNRLCYEN